MKPSIDFAQKMANAYSQACKPLCHELKIPQTAFDILMFLANNPEYQTASDIVEVRKIKANLVSINVDRLVKEGYLERKMPMKDRRKIHLQYTEKAIPVIQRGRELQDSFFEKLLKNISEDQREIFFQTLEKMYENLSDLPEIR